MRRGGIASSSHWHRRPAAYGGCPRYATGVRAGPGAAQSILFRNTVQRHSLLLQPVQHLGFIGPALPGTGRSYSAVHQRTPGGLLVHGQQVETEQPVALAVLHIGTEHGASQRRAVSGAWTAPLGIAVACQAVHRDASGLVPGGMARGPGAAITGVAARSVAASGISSHSRSCGSPCAIAGRLLAIACKSLRHPFVPEPVGDFLNQHGAWQGAAKGVERQESAQGIQVLGDPGVQGLAPDRQGQRLQVNVMRAVDGQGIGRAAKLLEAGARNRP